jgi:predicted CXXCH cytochrome family protein
MSKRIVVVFWMVIFLGVFSILGASNIGLASIQLPLNTQAVNSGTYEGAEQCATCHQDQYDKWADSYHNNAGLLNITDGVRYYWMSPAELHNGSTRIMNQTDFARCASCHTTGYDSDTGTWPDWNSTDPEEAGKLLGVQCEVCHGPYQEDHEDSGMPTNFSASLCSSCHSQAYDHGPSAHNSSLIALEASGHGRDDCLTCMSTQGAIGLDVTMDTPGLEPVSCLACHTPHDAENEFQLRAESQTEMCGQCHDAPPRHVNYALFVEGPHEKAGLECTSCHGQGTRLWHGSESTWFNHTFGIYNTVYPYNQTEPLVCANCHDIEWAETQLGIIQGTVGEMIANVTAILDYATTTIADANATAGVDQTKITQAVDLADTAETWVSYVENDRSDGFHNPEQAYTLLSEAYRLAFEAESVASNAQQDAMSNLLDIGAGELETAQSYLYIGAAGAIVMGLAVGLVVGRRWGK